MAYQPNDPLNPDESGEYRYQYQNIRQDVASGQRQYAPASENPLPDANQHKTGKKRRTALLLAACAVISLLCGAGGAVLAGRLGLTGSGNTVLYQSVPTQRPEYTATGFAAIVPTVEDSVVAITTESVATSYFFRQYIMQGAGSGVILTTDGYIVTNNHVVNGAREISVTLNDGTAYEATLIGADAENDIAVLKIDATGLTPAILGDSDTLAVGEPVLAIGNPLGTLSGTVTDGIISALQRQVTIDGVAMTLMQTSAAVNPGNSGGGLFNITGELIGIVNAKSSSDSSGNAVDNIGFAIPINSVKGLIDDLVTKGYVTGRIVLGVSLVDIPDERTAYYYGLDRAGVYVQSVESGSIAERSGLKAGDCLLTLNGQSIAASKDVTDFLSSASVGDRVEVTVSRGGKGYSLSMVLTEYIPESSKH